MSEVGKINLSDRTMSILNNFAMINNSMLFTEGKELKVVSETGECFGKAEIDEEIPREFAIYDMSKLLATLSLPFAANSDIVLYDDNEFMSIDGGDTRVRYHFTDTEFVKKPKSINMPPADLETTIENEVLSSFLKAAATLGLIFLDFKSEDGNLIMCGVTGDADTDDYRVELGSVDDDADFLYRFKVETLKLLPGDYDIEVSSKGIGKFTNKDMKVEYFAASQRV